MDDFIKELFVDKDIKKIFQKHIKKARATGTDQITKILH